MSDDVARHVNQFPHEIVLATRSTLAMLVEQVGLPCQLYIPKDLTVADADIYKESPVLSYEEPIETKVYIDWTPSIKKVVNLGIYLEDSLPILAYFKAEVNAVRGSWFDIRVLYTTPRDIQTTQFDITDQRVIGTHAGEEVIQHFVIAPRRKSLN